MYMSVAEKLKKKITDRKKNKVVDVSREPFQIVSDCENWMKEEAAV